MMRACVDQADMGLVLAHRHFDLGHPPGGVDGAIYNFIREGVG